VEGSCGYGSEPSGSIKYWEVPECFTTGDLSSTAQLLRLSYSKRKLNYKLNPNVHTPEICTPEVEMSVTMKFKILFLSAFLIL
jgi:hypothetical protein